MIQLTTVFLRTKVSILTRIAEELEADIAQSFLPDLFDPSSEKSEARIHSRACKAILILDYVSLLTLESINRSI